MVYVQKRVYSVRAKLRDELAVKGRFVCFTVSSTSTVQDYINLRPHRCHNRNSYETTSDVNSGNSSV